MSLELFSSPSASPSPSSSIAASSSCSLLQSAQNNNKSIMKSEKSFIFTTKNIAALSWWWWWKWNRSEMRGESSTWSLSFGWMWRKEECTHEVDERVNKREEIIHFSNVWYGPTVTSFTYNAIEPVVVEEKRGGDLTIATKTAVCRYLYDNFLTILLHWARSLSSPVWQLSIKCSDRRNLKLGEP